MGWTTPVDRAAGYTVTNTDWNVVEDDLTFLYGDSAWTNVSGFTNSWVSAASPNVARYMLMGRLVLLTGLITTGTMSTAAFTLPVGYRPSQTVQFVTNSNGAFGVCNITSAGVFTPTVGSNAGQAFNVNFSVA